MNSSKFNLYLGVAWILSLAVSFMIGWWKGVRGVTSVATGAAHSGFSFVIVALAVVALVSAVAAYRARGYFTSHSGHAS